MADTFPRQYARTRRLTLGEPRSFTVSPDGERVVFVRSGSGDDPVNGLWVLDVASGEEIHVVDADDLLESADADLPPQERARRERAREQAGGIVAYATNAEVTMAAFALAGRLFTVDLTTGAGHEIHAEGAVFDPRPDPTGARVAYVSGRSLCIADLDGTTRIIEDPDENVSWGSAEFVAAEEMDRFRGYWWSPEGDRVAACRVDVTNVRRLHLADPAEPTSEPVELVYPAAGTANADVVLAVIGLDGETKYLGWDRESYPYLVSVSWKKDAPLTFLVQSRDQRRTQVLAADPVTLATRVVAEDRDDAWIEVVPGSPDWIGDRLVMAADRDGARRIIVDDTPITPPDIQVRSIVAVDSDAIVFAGNDIAEPTELHVMKVDLSGKVTRVTTEPGVHTAVGAGGTFVVRSSTLTTGPITCVMWGKGGDVAIRSLAEAPLVEPSIELMCVGPRKLWCALLLPRYREPGKKLPVLLDPYGGPHHQTVVKARNSFLTAQWFADQGFAVLVVDGRGTPGRGSMWERAILDDFAGPVLEDQVDALQLVAADHPEMDLDRVAIRGWSFGGYLAALAVLRRPDVFHAAVAGAPVTDWRLYDTFYTERYLGDPNENADVYDRSGLLEVAKGLRRPLLLIHGLADDNVVAAHTLQLSRVLLEAGRWHSVLPLSGVTHMTPQEVVAENLLLLQVAFIRQSLGISIA
ncbi:MAG TPA: prolyl oligopeptidase family serine peptidase [Acidimicrobiales bacterium]|nr:prolyl oligopeptidase family serine peptidase [Acidimicrobiales bacterium]